MVAARCCCRGLAAVVKDLESVFRTYIMGLNYVYL